MMDRFERLPRVRFRRPSVSRDFAIGVAIALALAVVIIFIVEAFLRIHSPILGSIGR